MRRDIRIRVQMPAAVFGETHGFAFKLHAVPVNRIVIIRIGARKTDHSPSNHVVIAAVGRIAEETFNRHFQQQVKKHLGRHSIEIEIRAALRERPEIFILGLGAKIAKR